MKTYTKQEIDSMADDEALFNGIYKGKYQLFKVIEGHYLYRTHALDSDLVTVPFRLPD